MIINNNIVIFDSCNTKIQNRKNIHLSPLQSRYEINVKLTIKCGGYSLCTYIHYLYTKYIPIYFIDSYIVYPIDFTRPDNRYVADIWLYTSFTISGVG